MFYWMLYKNGTSSIEATDKTPVILWLQGGPGCSSMTGLFEELGPLRLNQTTMELYKTPISWQNDYHLLFIDNPIGAGYSYAASKDDYVTNYTQMADNLYYMLSQLATMYPTWFTGRQFFIFGESYAGHWVPAIAYKILEQNNNSTATHFPLAGIGIGDGWTDPYNQLSKNNEFGLSAGLTDINTANLV